MRSVTGCMTRTVPVGRPASRNPHTAPTEEGPESRRCFSADNHSYRHSRRAGPVPVAEVLEIVDSVPLSVPEACVAPPVRVEVGPSRIVPVSSLPGRTARSLQEAQRPAVRAFLEVRRTPGLRFVTVTKRSGKDGHGEWSTDLVAPGRLIPRRVVNLGLRPAAQWTRRPRTHIVRCGGDMGCEHPRRIARYGLELQP